MKLKTIRRIIFMTVAVCITQACKTKKLEKATKVSFNTKLAVYQNGAEQTVNNFSETIEINKSKFSLRFYNKKYDSENKKFYSAQIAAFTDKSEFDKLTTGLSMSNLPYFESGSGMAVDTTGKYETLFFNNSGHHYTFYENSDSKRLNLLENSGQLLKLEFEINSLYYGNKEVKMTETELKEFYLAFLVDKNLNEIIDKGELNKVTIKIK